MRSLFVNSTPAPLSVRDSKELQRITHLPTRDASNLGSQIAEVLSERLRLPHGKMTLRPLQAIALAEAADFGGAVVLLAVGEGKTLVSYLLPSVMKAERAVLLVPGALRDKTVREFHALRNDWVHTHMTVLSYEKVSTDPYILPTLNPDLIIADECHKLKSAKSSCTRRVMRQWRDTGCAFVPMSGSLTKRSFIDWWHLQLWALPEKLLVLPSRYNEAEKWAEALDEKRDMHRPLGALSVFGKTREEARAGYGERLRATPGVIVSTESSVDCSLSVRQVKFSSEKIKEVQKYMDGTWGTPNLYERTGEVEGNAEGEYTEASEHWRHMMETSLGFFYQWRRSAPLEWRQARKEVNQLVRKILKNSRKFDTPAQVMKAHENEPTIKRWLEIKDTFQPETVPVWFCDSVLKEALAFAAEEGGLVWTAHTAVGEALDDAGLPFFSSQGKDKHGKSIYDHTGPAAVSIAALGTGFNLQRWSRNLVLTPPPGGDKLEQLMGRTHRQGQEADNVHFDFLVNTKAQEKAFDQAVKDAGYIQRITGQQQKICYADHI